MTSLEGEQAGFFSTLMQSYNTNFANQQGILSSLTSALSPILQGGPSQMGFSPEETAALNSSAINNTAAQARNASVAAAQAGSEGGNTGVTTGGQAQLQAGIASQAGQSLGGELNQIQLASAQQGNANFFNAETALAGVGGLENPTGYAGQATGGGAAAFNSAELNNQASNQVWADLGGLAGAGLEGWAKGGFKNPFGGGSSNNSNP